MHSAKRAAAAALLAAGLAAAVVPGLRHRAQRPPALPAFAPVSATLPAGAPNASSPPAPRPDPVPRIFGTSEAAPPEGGLRQRRAARLDVDRGALLALLDGARERARLDLFDDVSLEVERERIESHAPDDSRVVWTGRVVGAPGGRVLLSRVDGALTGSVTLGDGRSFAVRPDEDGEPVVSELDPAFLPPCDAGLRGALLQGFVATTNVVTSRPRLSVGLESGVELDWMAVYSPRARMAAGGTAAMESLIQLAAAQVNQIYMDSGSMERLRVVHTEEVAYDESPQITPPPSVTALYELILPDDGVVDGVHALRDAHHADMVTLFIDPVQTVIGGTAGLAGADADIEDMAPFAFSIVTMATMTYSAVVAHELAHNQGAWHDRTQLAAELQGSGVTIADVEAEVGPYAFGYVDPLDRFHTLMAYPASCNGCGLAPVFSNPRQSLNGMPVGDSGSDVARKLDETLTYAVNWRVRPDAVPLLGPTPNEPVGTVANAEPTLGWSPVAGATWYRPFVDGNPLDWVTASEAGCADGATPCRTPGPRLADGTHTLAVMAWNEEQGNGPLGPTLAFVVQAPVGAPPAPGGLGPAGVAASADVVLQWNAVAGATWYQLYRSDASGAVSQPWLRAIDLDCDAGQASCTYRTGGLRNGDYDLWVRAYRPGAGSGPWSARTELTVADPDPSPPDAPSGLSPDGLVTVQRPVLQWTPEPDATWYQLWIQRPDGGVDTPWLRATSVQCAPPATTPCRFAFGADLANGMHRWWVRGWNVNGSGPWSAGATLDVQGPYAAPGSTTILAPLGTVSSGSPTIEWTAALRASSYQVWLEDAFGGHGTQSFRAWELGCGAVFDTCLLGFVSPLPSGDYTLWVRGGNDWGLGPWSPAAHFRVP